MGEYFNSTMVLLFTRIPIAKHIANIAVKSKKSSMATASNPKWTGVDKVVRDVFPEDYQLSGAIIGGYGTLIAFFAIKSKLQKKNEEHVPMTVTSTGDNIPSIDSFEFGN